MAGVLDVQDDGDVFARLGRIERILEFWRGARELRFRRGNRRPRYPG